MNSLRAWSRLNIVITDSIVKSDNLAYISVMKLAEWIRQHHLTQVEIAHRLDTSQGYVSGEISPLSFPTPVRQVKGNISALIGGTNPSVSLYFTARR